MMTKLSKKPTFLINDQGWAKELELAVEKYTDDLFNRVFEGGDSEVADTESGESFCGCNRCFWRETLVYFVPRLLVGYEQGKVDIEREA